MTRFGDSPTGRKFWWIFDPRCSLRARASLFFGSGAVLFTAVISWMGGSHYRQQLESQLGPAFETLAVQISDKVDRMILERHRELDFVGGLAPFRDGGAPEEQRRVLANLQGASPGYAWVGFINPAGRVIAATAGQFEGARVENHAWFHGARERPYAAVSGASSEMGTGLEGSIDGRRVVDLAIPVTGSNLEFAGVICAKLRWDSVTDIQLSVVPEQARRELLGVTIYASAADVLLDSDGSGWSAPPPAPTLSGTHRFRGSFIESTPEGTTYLTGYARSRGFGAFPGLGWLTIVRQPVDRAFAPARDFQGSVTRWGFGVSLLVFILSWFASAQLSRRIRSVTASALRIGAGDVLAVLPPPRGQSEIDEMCGAVSDLVEDLRGKTSPLQQVEKPPTQPGPPPGRERPSGADPRRVLW